MNSRKSNNARLPGNAPGASDLTTTELARLLHLRASDLCAAAARLGLCPGVEVVTDWSGPRVTRIWAPEWADDIRAEMERAERFDWTECV